MKRLSFSLATRTVLLVIAVLAVSETATFSLIFNNQRVAHSHQTGQAILGQIRLLKTVLPGMDDAVRQSSPMPMSAKAVCNFFPTVKACRNTSRTSVLPNAWRTILNSLSASA